MPRHLAPVRLRWPRLRWGARGHHRALSMDGIAISADERLEVLLPWAAVHDGPVSGTLGKTAGGPATKGMR